MRRIATILALALAALMVVAGVVSVFVGSPHPELATAGVGLALATGLIGNGNNRGRRPRARGK